MNQLEEIIQILSSGNEGVTNALLKTKILLFSIGKKELAAWVNYEINGYPDNAQLPDYRIVSTRILADLNNGVRHYNAFPLPISYLEDDDYEDATQSEVRLSISQVENLVLNAGDNHTLQQPIPLDIAYLKYCKSIERGYEMTRCYKEIALHNFVSILTQVRSRLLDFTLELSDHVDEIPGEKSMMEKLKNIDTASLFHNSIFGDNTVINFGNENNISVTNNISKNDLESLKKYLTEQGFSQDDVRDLEIAITSDGPIAPRNGNYGQSVSNWLANVVGKAAHGAMGIGIAVVTEVATLALKKYYGLE
ncbi:hypothetical protein HVX13_06005 [Citrobacter freundii]|nr:hypothetical protein [Citrobacter freundii]MBA8334556.1 hypothetical protein [Citrobacter freundii]QLM85432.1 hypothetical protein HVX13_06005 [Citrobacter freundii]QMM21393.1 hypothetical protein HVX18_06000 [Citrobacter freundii]